MASKDLNFNELYKQPFLVQIGLAIALILAILGLGYFVIFSDQRANLAQIEQEEITLREDFSNKAKKAAQLPILQKQLEQINASFAVLLRQLPTEAQVPNLIQELHDAASANGMRLNTVTPQPTQPDGEIEILPYKIALSGSHDQLSRFARDVGKLSRIITLSEIQLKTTPTGKQESSPSEFTLTAMANTYKAIDTNAQLKTEEAPTGTEESAKPAPKEGAPEE